MLKLFVFNAKSNRFSGVAHVVANHVGEATTILRQYAEDFHTKQVADWVFQSFVYSSSASRPYEGWYLSCELPTNLTDMCVKLKLDFPK